MAAVLMAAAAGANAQTRSEVLGAAQSFAVLGGSTVTSTGATVVTGQMGVWPGTDITGFPPGTSGTVHAGNETAQIAQGDAAVAYNALAGMALTQTLSGVNLGGLTLGPGVYRFDEAAALSSTPLTLDGMGDPNGLFVFQIGTTLITDSNAMVNVINGGDPCNIYWQVGTSATLGTGTSLKGTVIAQASITLATGASIWEGGAIAQNGAVTMDTSIVSLAGCAALFASHPAASAEAGGRTTISFVDPNGRPVMLQRTPTGEWTAEALTQTAAPVPTTGNPGAAHTFVGPRDGKSYVTVTSAEGLFVVDTAASPLGVRNLMTEAREVTPEATAITGPSTVFQSGPEGDVNVVGVNDAGEVVRYYQTGGQTNGQADWAFMNITATQLTPYGIETPEFASNLVSYVSEWGGLHVAGLDSAGQVNAVWWAPGAAHWSASNVSAEAESPPFMVDVGLTAYATPWGGLNLAGLDEQGHVIVQWWSPQLGAGNWETTDLTETYGGPALGQAGLTSFVLPWGALNVAGVTPEGELVNYWWMPGFDQWIVTSIQDAAADPDAPRLTGAMMGVGAPDGVASIIGGSANGDMIRYFWEPGDGGTWSSENVTEIATPRP